MRAISFYYYYYYFTRKREETCKVMRKEKKKKKGIRCFKNRLKYASRETRARMKSVLEKVQG
jgi:hypothetical protein